MPGAVLGNRVCGMGSRSRVARHGFQGFASPGAKVGVKIATCFKKTPCFQAVHQVSRHYYSGSIIVGSVQNLLAIPGISLPRFVRFHASTCVSATPPLLHAHLSQLSVCQTDISSSLKMHFSLPDCNGAKQVC